MRGRRAAAGGAVLASLALAVGCSSSDVTGEPEDVGALVEVVASQSECAARDGDVVIHVTLRNEGDDARTVTVVPVLRGADGTERESPLEAVEITVGGGESADAEATVDDPPDDLDRCAVRLDAGEPVEIALRGG